MDGETAEAVDGEIAADGAMAGIKLIERVSITLPITLYYQKLSKTRISFFCGKYY